MPQIDQQYNYRSFSTPELSQLEKEMKEYDFVNYHSLIIGTLYNFRFESIRGKFKTDKILNIFVKRMKEQISALPKNCELRKAMSNKLTGCKAFTLTHKCDKAKAIKILNRLVELGLFEYSNNGSWISTIPNKKLNNEAKRIINEVDNLYFLDTNNLRIMIYDCVEEIISSKNDCMIIRKPKEDPKVEKILNNFEEFYEGLKVIDKYLKPKKKKLDNIKEIRAYTDPIIEYFDNMENVADDTENTPPEDEAN